MKTSFLRSPDLLQTFIYLFAILVMLNSCDKNVNLNGDAIKENFSQVNLVANTSGWTGARVDANLVNGWGMAFSPTGNIWISAEDAGKSVIYDKTGAEKLAAVSIPSPTASTGGTPTGQVFNGSSDFVLPGGGIARFIFAGTDGVISGWSSGSSAVRIVDNSSAAVYLGLAIGNYNGQNYIYAADFKGGKIDVFDKNFSPVAMSFADPNPIGGYAPFNIQHSGNVLFVMYAKVDPEEHEEEKGPGLGYINEYDMGGNFLRKFTTGGALNAPWGIAIAPSSFMNSVGSVVLVGNFGDGRINAFDMNGNYIGSLKSNGQPIEIDGLWGISFAPSTATTVDPNWLFFAAGPADEEQGLFGYIKP